MAKFSWQQWTYVAFGTCVLGLSLKPVFGSPHEDGYPFSSYPMFAGRRSQPQFAVAQMQDKKGDWQKVAPRYLGTDEVMQAAATIRKASRSKKRAGRLCRAIAERVATEEPAGAFQRVQIVRVTYDPLTYFSEGAVPLKKKKVVSCRVKQGKGT